MKRTMLFLFVAGALAACNNSGQDKAKDETKSEDAKLASANDTKMDYAYTIEHPDQWETGNRENTRMVLASLKQWEAGDMDAATKDFADSVDLSFDGWEAKLAKDSVNAMFKEERKKQKAVQVVMEDFESVRSKDTGVEYVSLWYKQKSQDLNGKWDSVSVMDDLRIKNGKIASIDEKRRHYAKKKM